MNNKICIFIIICVVDKSEGKAIKGILITRGGHRSVTIVFFKCVVNLWNKLTFFVGFLSYLFLCSFTQEFIVAIKFSKSVMTHSLRILPISSKISNHFNIYSKMQIKRKCNKNYFVN
jgi:hypothetical protein